jgi:hypothetical protein
LRWNDTRNANRQQQLLLDFAAGATALAANGIDVPQPGKMP